LEDKVIIDAALRIALAHISVIFSAAAEGNHMCRYTYAITNSMAVMQQHDLPGKGQAVRVDEEGSAPTTNGFIVAERGDKYEYYLVYTKSVFF
jgi:hypothetical protein